MVKCDKCNGEQFKIISMGEAEESNLSASYYFKSLASTYIPEVHPRMMNYKATCIQCGEEYYYSTTLEQPKGIVGIKT